MKHGKLLVIVTLISLFIVGCAGSRSGKVYSRDEARRSLHVYYGTILEVHEAQIEGTKTAAGPLAGAAAGGVLGNTVGGGSGKAVGAVLGAIAGSLAGAALEETMTRKEALEITVEMDDGRILAIVQEADDYYQTGDRIRVVKSQDGTMRVRQ